MKKNVSYAQPLLEEIHEKRGRAHEDSELRGMIKDMNTKLIEQKIVVAKLNKLCLGALTSVEHLAKKGKKMSSQELLMIASQLPDDCLPDNCLIIS